MRVRGAKEAAGEVWGRDERFEGFACAYVRAGMNPGARTCRREGGRGESRGRNQRISSPSPSPPKPLFPLTPSLPNPRITAGGMGTAFPTGQVIFYCGGGALGRRCHFLELRHP